MKVFVVDVARCNGCFNCQLACKDEHVENEWLPYARSQPDIGHFWLELKQTTHGQAPKVRVEYRPELCGHCENAPCMAAAKGCIYRREDGLVIIDPDKATGRRDLVEACPFGRIFYNDELDLPQKCTGCAHLVDEGKMPHCVDLCSTGALRFGDEEEFADEIARADVACDQSFGSHVYYLGLPGLFAAGEVWDPQADEIIEGARVSLKGKGQVLETLTDGFGDFWFKELERGEYELCIEAAGYAPVAKEIALDKSLNLRDFPLERLA